MDWGGIVLWVLLIGIISRIITVWILTGYPLEPLKDKKRSLKTLVVLGSGGHTAEILNVMKALNFARYCPRCYIAAVTDNHSLAKAQRIEEASVEAKAGGEEYLQASYYQIYRSREVGQSYLTSIGTTLLAMAHAFWLVVRLRPDVILCNGPGTCLPICIAGFFLKIASHGPIHSTVAQTTAKVPSNPVSGAIDVNSSSGV